ncbi:52 kDa repressor of the inhibitor of the protein kinase-like [Aphis gossypii]|uniref:52 kDa repressor of the inhibitor of the protein kinase-like n=1 Tax=Aphis gossypii TaxID=80765 RepID=UPI0021599550|nr:52 kDa repressor of the inhibitor of the protein kinase-like [Aphis gossypii]
MDLAEVSVTSIQGLRENINEEFNELFKEAEKMANILDITISVKRLNKRSTRRANPCVKDANEYYRITVVIPYIDYFIQQLNERFMCHKNIFKGFQSLFSGLYSDEFGELITFYLDSDKNTVIAELHLWHALLEKNEQLPKNSLEALRLCKNEIFSNIYSLLKILCTLPVSTATPERTFSCLKRLKNYLSSTMTETRLNGLTMLAVHKEVPITAEEVLDELAKKPRKLDFLFLKNM